MNYFRRISVNEADHILTKNPEALLLDIRSQQDYEEGHHPRARLLTDSLLRKIIKTKDKNIPIIIYCYHGNSSQDIARMFADFGFKLCYSVDGGYGSWRHQVDENFPVSEKLAQWITTKEAQGKDINARVDTQNRTLLMLAAKSGRDDIVHDLVEAGADPNMTDANGNNALLYACLGQNIRCVRLLINADVEVDNQNIYGFTALNYSVGLDDIFSILANYFRNDSLLRLGQSFSNTITSSDDLPALAV